MHRAAFVLIAKTQALGKLWVRLHTQFGHIQPVDFGLFCDTDADDSFQSKPDNRRGKKDKQTNHDNRIKLSSDIRRVIGENPLR